MVSPHKQKNPTRCELKVRNNLLHVRTCPDSMRALGDLINYLACVGDLRDPTEATDPPPNAQAPQQTQVYAFL